MDVSFICSSFLLSLLFFSIKITNFLLLFFAYVAKGKIILVSPEYVAGIYAFFYIGKVAIVAVGNDGLRLLLKCCKVVHHKAAK